MKRGFLNSEKAKRKPLSGNTASSAVAPASQKHSPPSADRPNAVPYSPTKPSGPVVGIQLGGRISAAKVEPYAVVRFPSVRLTQSKEPSSNCIFRPSTCIKVMGTPGFYTRLPPLNPTDVVLTKSTPSMGLGLFTKRGVKADHTIFWERPVLILPMGTRIPYSEGLTEEDAIALQEAKSEETLRQTLNAMPKEDADAFMSLSNCISDSLPLSGIARTNAFGTHIEEANLQLGNAEYGVICKTASRINHSCTANVIATFDIATFAFHVMAKRDIEVGEQLFYCYCEAAQPVQERRRQLATYGFVCQCKACVQESGQ